jgi:hypothetical protein
MPTGTRRARLSVARSPAVAITASDRAKAACSTSSCPPGQCRTARHRARPGSSSAIVPANSTGNSGSAPADLPSVADFTRKAQTRFQAGSPGTLPAKNWVVRRGP